MMWKEKKLRKINLKNYQNFNKMWFVIFENFQDINFDLIWPEETVQVNIKILTNF